MADSWQQIDNDGVMMDWTDSDTIKLCDLWHPLEAIRRAINERETVARMTNSSPVLRLDDLVETCEIFNTAINSLSSLFIPFSTTADWDGESTLPTYTSMSTLLAEIGDASRLTANRLDDIYAWMHQTYRLLNRMLWTKYEPVMFDCEAIGFDPYGETWGSAPSSLLGMPFQYKISGTTSMSVTRFSVANDASIRGVFQLYLKVTNYPGLEFANASGWTADVFNLIQTQTVYGNFETATEFEPKSYLSASLEGKGYVTGNVYNSGAFPVNQAQDITRLCIAKFNGTGGFKFK